MIPRTCIPLILICVAALLSCVPQASAQRTTRRALKPVHRVEAPAEAVADTLFAPSDSLVSLSGYDKPLRSRKESFFVSNHSQHALSALNLTIDYFDTSERRMHSRTLTIDVDIPAGDTRKVDIPSWDTQLTFYYRDSAPARLTTRCYPYSVASRINFILCSPCSDL